jgi:hypothetical protein
MAKGAIGSTEHDEGWCCRAGDAVVDYAMAAMPPRPAVTSLIMRSGLTARPGAGLTRRRRWCNEGHCPELGLSVGAHLLSSAVTKARTFAASSGSRPFEIDAMRFGLQDLLQRVEKIDIEQHAWNGGRRFLSRFDISLTRRDIRLPNWTDS